MSEGIVTYVGGRADLHDVEHAVLRLRDEALPGAAIAGTRYDDGNVVGFVALPGAELPADGRLFRFPGQAMLSSDVTVREIKERSAIVAVRAMGGPIDDDSIVVTRNYVRPILEAGSIVLYVTPLADGRFQPFELEHPHRCCEADAEPSSLNV